MRATERLIFVTVAIVASIAIGLAHPEGRIHGGKEAGTGEYPFAVSVRLDGAHVCGGSILDNYHILTAAHCVVEKSGNRPIDRLSVRAGSTNQFAGGSIFNVAEVHVHENYENEKNDIAVIKLASALVFNDKIARIAIATSAADQPPVDAKVTVAGWGQQNSGTSPYKLQFAEFKVASKDACKDAYSGADASVLCLSHELKSGSCYGDGGNGGVYKYKLVAVTNFVVGACGARYPDVYANVYNYAKWINDIL